MVYKLLAVLVCCAAAVAADEVVLGMGCFFKAKKTFQEAEDSGKLKLGSIEQGYAGGFFKKPDYRSVMKGKTGHAEVIKITYTEADQPLRGIMSVFWHGHDPTSMHAQGDEIGSQYRSLVLYNTSAQNETIFASLEGFLAESELLEGKAKIQTEVLPLEVFWPAESNISTIAPIVDAEIKQEHDTYVKHIKAERKGLDRLTANLDPNVVSKRHLDKSFKKHFSRAAENEDSESDSSADAKKGSESSEDKEEEKEEKDEKKEEKKDEKDEKDEKKDEKKEEKDEEKEEASGKDDKETVKVEEKDIDEV
eukprot:TRINITY_DN3074_c0_g2_i1.p1 TRINITY_DN3074_c0_g2~~TRINITY_DN3074_c0_g2_i1.p1  ORF type:complete len:307 (+),score=107.92 TRINITY_DN3074_c0_g2_i1:49-969(+)